MILERSTTTQNRSLPNFAAGFHLGTTTTIMTTATTTTMIQTQTRLILKNILEDRTAFSSAAALGAAQERSIMIPRSTQ